MATATTYPKVIREDRIVVNMSVSEARYLVSFSDKVSNPFLVGTGPVTEAVRNALSAL